MYLTLRQYAGAGPRVDQIAGRLEGGLVPLLKRSPGFKGYCALGSEDGDGVSMSLFETVEQANKANEQARSWVQSNMRDLLPDPPEVFAGESVLLASADGQDGSFGGSGGPLYVMIRQFENITDPDFREQFTREVSMPAVSSSPGFKAFYGAWGDLGRTRAALVSLFDSRENADRSYERVKELIRQKGGSAIPPPDRVVAGRAVVIAAGT
jgi:heme-degrading monooxygenase HmoA